MRLLAAGELASPLGEHCAQCLARLVGRHAADHTGPYAPAVDIAAHLDLALELADAADAITMARFRATDLKVSTKPDLTPVSEADQAVERAIRDRLADATGHAVLGEEYGEGAGGDEDADFRWIIDPIDGTKSYVRGLPIWATLIGLEHAGELVVGVASAPALHARWWAGRGLGAFRDGDPISVSEISSLDDAQISFSWDTRERFEANGIGEKMLALAHRCWRFRGVGDFWQYVLVAEGAVDIAMDPIVNLWDVAALVPIIEESGGRWSTLDGRPDVNGGDFVCTNGPLHDTVLAALE
jgi:histidinol-phosphatase